MKLRKKMLMMMLVCLVGFQPTVRANDYELLKVFIAIGIIWNIRPIGNVLGNFFSGLGQILVSITQMPKLPDKPDSAALRNAKKLFDQEFKKFKSEDNIECTYNVYNKLPALETASELSSICTEKEKQTMVGFLEECEKKAALDPNKSILLGSSCKNIYGQEEPLVLNIVKLMNLTQKEYENVYIKTVKSLDLRNGDFGKLIVYMDQELIAYHKDKNKKIITLCSAHTACEHGTAKAVKKIAVDMNPSEIVLRFHAAAQIKMNMNKFQEEVTQTSMQNVLASFGQRS